MLTLTPVSLNCYAEILLYHILKPSPYLKTNQLVGVLRTFVISFFHSPYVPFLISYANHERRNF